jgi:hypothetical protein
MTTFNRPPFAQSCVDFLLGYYGADDLDLVNEYISEAEHQDGFGYWDNFKSLAEVSADFELYRDAR